jgi:glycosyltransferase involved in cell wall biosynthesis
VQQRGRENPKAALLAAANAPMRRIGVRNADCVICVYRYMVPWARAAGARRVEVIPNAVAADAIVKEDYALGNPPRVIVPGRQIRGKDPTPVIDAVSQLPGVELVLVGDGDLHAGLMARATRLGIEERVRFHRTVPNAELMRLLPQCDVLVSVNDHGGVSKVELEAALTGMPIVTNAHPLEDTPELLDEACVTVAGDARSYEGALRGLLADERRRAALGRAVRANAELEASPSRSERAVVDLYRGLLGADAPIRSSA